MKRTFYLALLGTLILSLGSIRGMSQNVPVGTPVVEDYYRRAQLLGDVDSTISFTIRPVFPQASMEISDPLDPDTVLNRSSTNGYRASAGFERSHIRISLLPLSWQQQYNTHHPYGWNDGVMIPAKGYQALFSGGIFAKAGPLEIQIRPEYVFAQNTGFEAIDIYTGAPDIPVRFGEGSYSSLSWGQSSVRLKFGSLSVGLSNENLYWGPGNRSSLILSNNGPGFKHLTFNTVKPLSSPIGLFEFQLIAGRLEGSGYSMLESIPKFSDWRYLSAVVFSFHPKWVPGLFVGLTRSFQNYKRNVKGFRGYMPIFAPYQKVKDSNNVGGSDGRDQLTSVFSRWLFTKSHAEVYLEYGLNDNSYNLRDFIGSPEHSRAYVFGMTKLTKLWFGQSNYIRANLEFTQITQPIDRLVRDSGSWYHHSEISHGYTHKGQVLGAGIGPGASMQSFNVSWVEGMKSLGLGFERFVQNDDYYDNHFGDLNGYSRRWVDMSVALNGTWNFKNLLLNAKMQFINSMNYQWQLKNYQPGAYYIPENDIFNFHGQLGLTYRF